MLTVRQALNAVVAPRTGLARRHGPIGIDIGSDVVHLCQLRPQEAGRFAVVAHAAIAFSGSRRSLIESPARLRKLLRDGMRGLGFSGRRAVAAMPADWVKFTPITYKADARSAGETILKMLSSRVEGQIGEYVVDYLPVRTSSEQEESLALAAVARREDVLQFLDAITGAGFEVDALDIGPAAIKRLLSVLYTGEDEEGETILVVNTGLDRSYLSVISGRRLLFDQPVTFGEKTLLSHLAKVLDLSEKACRDLVLRHGLEKAAGASGGDGEVPATLLEILKHEFVGLVEEINRILIFTAAETRGRPIGRICLLGSIARWPGAEMLLRDLIDVPGIDGQSSLADFFIDQPSGRSAWAELLPEMAVVTGLALRGLIDHE